MSFTLTLRFTGLCCFVQHTTKDRMKVLLVECRRKDDHLSPVIMFDREQLDKSNLRHPDLIRHKHDTDANDGLCFIDREDLMIDIKNNSEPTKFELDNSWVDPEKEPDKDGQITSWSFVPDLARIRKNAKVDPDCFKPAPTSGRVTARLDLNNGRFFSDELLRSEKPKEERHLQFVKLGSGNPRLATAVAGCAIELSNGTEVSISSRRWLGGKQYPLVFKRDYKNLHVDIWNVPFYDLMDAWGARPHKKCWPAPDDHEFGNSFAHHFDILEGSGSVVARRFARKSKKKFKVRNKDKEKSCMPTVGPTTDFD